MVTPPLTSCDSVSQSAEGEGIHDQVRRTGELRHQGSGSHTRAVQGSTPEPSTALAPMDGRTAIPPATEALSGTPPLTISSFPAPPTLSLNVPKYTEVLLSWVLAPAFLPGNLFPSVFQRSEWKWPSSPFRSPLRCHLFRDTMPDCLSSPSETHSILYLRQRVAPSGCFDNTY